MLAYYANKHFVITVKDDESISIQFSDRQDMHSVSVGDNTLKIVAGDAPQYKIEFGVPAAAYIIVSEYATEDVLFEYRVRP